MKLNLKLALTIHAVIFILYGIMDLFFPRTAINSFGEGIEATPILILSLQIVGASFLSLAALTWFLREAHLSHGRRAALFCLAIGNVLSAIIQIKGIMEGTLNSMNWIGVIVTVVFGIIYLNYATKEHKGMVMKMRDYEKEKTKA